MRNFLLAAALHWLREYHIDGLRVDAVSSMLYRDYDRKPGDWIPNDKGGNANDEAVSFLQELTSTVHQCHRDVLMIAEESTAWQGVTAPTAANGLGFDLKWNMGWMHDTLGYLSQEPVMRLRAATTASPSISGTPTTTAGSCRCPTMKWCTARRA